MNYHALNDFRSCNEVLMDDLLTDNVAALAAVGAISLECVAQDDAHRCAGTAVDRLGRRCEFNFLPGRVRVEKCVNAS